jgi:hypothetical protein
MMQIDWLLALAVALEAAGAIQWGKGWLKGAPTWVWSILLPLLCIGLAVAPAFVHVAALGMAFAQLGYETIIKAVVAKTGITVTVPATTPPPG